MANNPDKVDRQTTVPFHLKLFYKTGSHHRLDDFPIAPNFTSPQQYLQIYTWPTCTLRELSHLLTSALPSLLPSPSVGTKLSYRLVYPNTRDSGSGPRYLSKELGSITISSDDGNGSLPGEEEGKMTVGGAVGGRLEGEPERMLKDAMFVIGDFVSCAIYSPGTHEVSAGQGGFRGRGRENGFGDRGYRGRGGGGGGYRSERSGYGRLNDGSGGLPPGEWRRGERVPDGPGGGRGYGRGRGRGW